MTTALVQRPFDPAPALASIVAHAVPGVETVDGSTVRRVVRFGGEPALVEATLLPDRIELRGSAGTPEDLVALAHSWFGLGDDLGAVHHAFEADPVLGPLVRARSRLRILGHPDGFEAAMATVLGQQVSLAAARTFGGRLAAAYGTPGPGGLIAYPTPDRLARADAVELQSVVRITHARARTLHAVADACARGLTLAPGSPDARARLLELPGIGPWTADYLALRVLGDRDAMPMGDLVLRRALAVRTATEVTRLAEQWRPLRAFAAVHLWTATAYAL
ncbi:DNA-3-methyladenine glycosylase family protein [Cellulomonas fengjieae]|uniref:DNA-3-methyladenine glycosylase II n=1 Tax=Cellulomonas fengjieae TaxID=2819978 RepID=A0ABS3SEL7_9CELL|nr:AlkA N-terminal domain-containing protein [Cellulomonas fengjieae]MBO3083764.1 DNA-3-methyladenine glycosylase 2 family protein [Cellulomonas fengjieae]QVI64940.1 DNA-3-methyladenine glycosylase 2 family protein [Cellulomonas fengjieae]